MSEGEASRRCGECDLCCRLLRVDDLAKLGGVPCTYLRDPAADGAAGCGVHELRPEICRGYRCLWLRGSFDDADRPDRLGAILDLEPRGGVVHLRVHEVTPGSYDRSPRIQELVAGYRESMPVRVLDADDVMTDRPVRVLLPGDAEQRLDGERIEVLRGGEVVESRRLPWLERIVRRLSLRWQRRRLRAWEAGGTPTSRALAQRVAARSASVR